MKNTLRAATLAALVSAGTLGFVGTAAATTDLCAPASIDAQGMCHMQASGPFSDIDVAFPAHTAAQPAIEAYVNSAIETYTAATEPAADRTGPAALQITGTRLDGPHSTSVVLDVFQNRSGAMHPNTWYQTFTTDAATSAPITFDTLFRPGTAPLTRIAPIVARDLDRQWGEPADIPAEALHDPANYQNFAITADAVVFYFDRNELRAATGNAHVSVPRTAIADLLAPGR